MGSTPDDEAIAAPRWQAISATDRRVLGVLIEKAKTTPEQYPLSLNAVRTACNQKSNRHPAMELDDEQVQDALDRLRKVGAVALVQSGGRIERFRHLAYEWFLVDKVELAVMAELLLRGAQTEGELRTRASRMEPISDLGALRAVLDRLKAKNLIVSLTREGRGHIISHNLYKPEELEKLRRQFAQSAVDAAEPVHAPPERELPPSRAAEPYRAAETVAAARALPTPATAELDSLRRELRDVRTDLNAARESLDQLSSELEQCRDEIRQLKDALGV
jgi:uncharacterized protein YceH (UPF0502 family)